MVRCEVDPSININKKGLSHLATRWCTLDLSWSSYTHTLGLIGDTNHPQLQLQLSPPSPRKFISNKTSNARSPTMLYFFFLLLLQACTTAGNTEKAIFLGPPSLQIPIAHPTLKDLNLVALSPSNSSIRTHLPALFPTTSSQYGYSTWILLHSLKEGQRYEVRVCWAATVSSLDLF